MILSTMGFLLVASAVAGAGAMSAEAGLRRMGASTRFAWLGALALGPALLIVRWALPGQGASAPAPAWAPVIDLPALDTPVLVGWALGLDWAAASVWAVSAAWVLVVVARTHRVLALESAAWERARVMGRHVLVSADRGPAVAGVWDPWIVLPRWALSLPRRELRLILLHEEEHLHARDTRLLGLALALVCVNAWNPLVWWHLRRLKGAMEIDCDRRVLARDPDRATYGASLLSVAARGVGPSLGLATFTEGSFNLKRRILAMTAKATGWTVLGGGMLFALGVVVGAQTCGIESPVEPQTSPDRSAAVVPAQEEPPPPVRVVPGDTLGEKPVFTPYTVAPDLVNRAEVAAAFEKGYPPLLRNAGIGGTATVYVFIDVRGEVANTRIHTSSGHPALDEAALQIGRVMRFSPARNGDVIVPVWVSLPITFQVR